MNTLARRTRIFDDEAERSFVATRERVALVAAFLIGALNPFAVRLVGLMPLSEVVVLVVLAGVTLGVLLTGRSPVGVDAPRLLVLLLGCQMIGLGGYVFSDLVRESAPGDMIRGWSRMVFLMLDTCCVAFLVHCSRRILGAVACGIVVGVCEPLLHGPLFGDWWKFGFGLPVTVLLCLAGPLLLGRVGAVAALAAIAVAHFLLDFRSMAALCLAVAALLSLRFFDVKIRRALFVLGAIAALSALPFIVERAFSADGHRASRSNAERSAMLQAATEAFLQSPLIGSGSWFSNTGVMDDFLVIRKINARLAGVGGFDERDAEGLAIHSQLLVSLAEGGIFGAAFFIAYGCLLLLAIYLVAVEIPFHQILPFMLFFLFMGFFNLLMSPFSGAHRVDIAITVAVILKSFSEFFRARQTETRALPSSPTSAASAV